MGTRADFYRGGTQPDQMVWLGSIAWDGYPEGIDGPGILDATTEEGYVAALMPWLSERHDATLPEQGWPWPWEDSNTTDYAYTFADGKVLANGFGHGWFVATLEDEPHLDDKPTPFPDMTAVQNVTMGKRSGIMIIDERGVVEGEP